MPARDHIGLAGPAYEVDIERGKIREFARAMNAPLADFLDGPAPVVPATFLVSAPYTWGYTLERPRGTAFAQIDEDLSVPLHAEEEFRFPGPMPRAGDRLIARTILEDVREKSGRSGGRLTFLTMLTEYRDRTGRIVVEQRSTTVTTARNPGDDDWVTEAPDYNPAYPLLDPGDPFTAIVRAGWDDLVEGDGPGAIDTGPLMLGDIVRFQGVVGEDNPLHSDVPWAQANGYPTVFGLGMQQASILAAYAAHWIDPATVRRFRARFRNVYWPGDRMIYAGRVKSLRTESDDRRIVELLLDCTRQDGSTLVDVEMTCELPPKIG